MSKKLTGKPLAKFEAKRDVWQETLDGVREIKAGGGRKAKVEAKSYVLLRTIQHAIVLCPQCCSLRRTVLDGSSSCRSNP
jgi:hypothetical protein